MFPKVILTDIRRVHDDDDKAMPLHPAPPKKQVITELESSSHDVNKDSVFQKEADSASEKTSDQDLIGDLRSSEPESSSHIGISRSATDEQKVEESTPHHKQKNRNLESAENDPENQDVESSEPDKSESTLI